MKRNPNAKRPGPIHPGEILLHEFMLPLNISQYRLAKDLGVPAIRISAIVRSKRGVSADTALRLARYLGMSAQFWMNAQAGYELEIARDATQARIDRQVPVFAA